VRFTGQHFTIDKYLIKDMIKHTNILQDDLIIEIGAGKGYITSELLNYSNNIIAIENDRSLLVFLKRKFKSNHNILIYGIDYRNYVHPKEPFKVLSNIPFAITSEILKSLMFYNFQYFSGGCLILQKEAALKIIKKNSVNPFVIFFNTFFDIKIIYYVLPDSFLPPSNVNSALVAIKKKEKLNINPEFSNKYFLFLSFMLKKSEFSIFKALKEKFNKNIASNILNKLNISQNKKIHNLTVENWIYLFNETKNYEFFKL